MHALESADEILAAQHELKRQFQDRAEHVRDVQIGYQGGAITADVYWHPNVGIWGSLNDSPPDEGKGAGRFWNAFGTQDPHRHGNNLSIVCEANPAHSGVNRRVAGLFARDDHGRTYLLHTGRIGGSRKGIGMRFFWDHWQRPGVTVAYPEPTVECATVADLGSSRVPSDIAHFVKEVERIKALIRP